MFKLFINYKSILNKLILVAVVFIILGAGFWIGKGQVVCNACKPETLDFSLFWDAYEKLNQGYISPEKIDSQKAVYGAIKGMTNSLGDPYTEFFSPQQAKTFEQDLSGSFSGIGIEIGIKNSQLTVIAPLKDSPGERAGLESGDQILKVDGKSTADLSVNEVVYIIRGERGKEVTLNVFRDGWDSPKDFKIIRDIIKVDSLKWEIREDGIAYLHIIQFDQSLNKDFIKAAFEIQKSPAKKIILDLRNNPGGYLEIAQDIAGWFLKKGQVVAIEDFGEGKQKKLYKSEGNGQFADFDVVVLINKGSASASEILAGALRDNRNVKLVGEKSFGKGSVQELVRLQDNKSFLKITIAKWLTPNGVSISEVGLDPDVKVEMTDGDIKAEKDTQFQKAIEIIKGLQ